VPKHLPTGWALAWAIERPGAPVEDWETHSEVFANHAHDEFLLITAREREPGRPTKPGAPTKGGFDVGFGFAAIADFDVPYEEFRSLHSSWHSAHLTLDAMHLARRPSAALLKRFAAAFADEDALGFSPPRSIEGFEHAGGSGGDVPDYTIVFAPKRFVGSSRAQAEKLTDDAPTLSLNVGAHFYAQRPGLPTLDDPRFERDDGRHAEVEFVYAGSQISVSADVLSRAELMAVAESLARYDRSTWRKRLGSRLYTQDPSD
jgi:hypothetical protein